MKRMVLATLLALFFPVISYAQMGGGMMGGGMMGGGMMGPGQGYQRQPFQTQGPGADIFRVNCRSCHAQGGNLIYPNLPLRGAPQLADFNAFLAFIRHPAMPDGSQGRMPAFTPEKVSDDQARQLYQFLIFALGGPAQGGQGYGYRMGPGYGMGPGMMGRGYGGYGRMGPGYGYGYGPQYRGQYQQPPKPLDKEQAKQEVENYLKSTKNPNLKLGKIEEKDNAYEVDIETKEGSLVDKIVVDKATGRMQSAY